MAVKKPLADIIKKELNIKDYPSWMKEDFNVVFSDENFKKLYKKESTIDVDFHGNRDFYYLIKGIARDLNNVANTKNLVTMIIEKYIERNFGGIEFEIERKEYYDFKPFKLIKEIRANIAEKKEKISSVVLFKIVHNLVINEIYNDKENKPIIENVKKYDILENIIDNLNDRNSRYILLEIKPAIAPLIKQSISKKLNKNEEKIKFYEGSPFINDNDNEYQFKMLNILQNHTSNGDIIIYQNLEQIYAYLYDLFNMNYIVNNEKNYARISHGNYSEQLVYIHDNFKCIVMEDKKYINMVDPPFFNRFEKFMISIDKLLSPAKKKFFEEIWDNGINLTEIIENVEKIFDINYDLKNLLIGCKKQDIQGLIFNLSQNNDDSKNEKIEDKEEIKRQIYDKISKLLPQDIIINLPDTNLLKISYFKNRHFSKLIDYLEICEKKDYKISIIYTFSFSDFSIDGVELSSSHMISEIQSEKMLYNLINDKIKINKSKKNNKKYILLQFDVSQSNKLNFVVSFINNNFSDEEYKNYKFICIIHVRRNFKEKNFDYNKKIKIVKNEQKPLRISNIFDVYPNVNQIFIDNLIGENITLDNILNRPIKNTLEESNDLEEIFFKVLKSFIFKNEPNNKNSSLKADLNGKDYEKLSKDIEETFKYNEKAFMRNILEKAKSFVKGFGKDLIEKIYKDEYIKKNSIDIVSIFKDYISEVIFEEILTKIFYILEDNNFLTTLMVLNKKKEKDNLLKKEILNEIKNKQLQELDINIDQEYKPKFNENYLIPGFYKFYEQLSDFISHNIAGDYVQNENKLRKFKKGDIEEVEKKFHNKESDLLNSLYQEVRKNKMIFNIMSHDRMNFKRLYNLFHIKILERN